MIRLLLLCAFATFAQQSIYAQERSVQDSPKTRSISAEAQRDKAVYVASLSPNITVNGTKCKFEKISIERGSDGKYAVRINFEENCSGSSEVHFNATDLEDALELKDLITNFRAYESLNITGKKGEPMSFEVNFIPPVKR